ncbi:MAG: hypothetical protein KDA88_08555 [Planctomycetaceae bacterium]|nr:hypothetical protein [Planctomycetaceae bacterium]
MPFLKNALIAALPILIGCSNGHEPPPLASVSGQLLVDGKGMEGMTVRFIPESSDGIAAPVSSAITTSNGKFTLVAENSRVGVVAGKHRVCVECPNVASGPANSSESGKTSSNVSASGRDCDIPRGYSHPETTPLFVTISARGGADFLIQVDTNWRATQHDTNP